ncbi:MAG: hypothetical protein M1553_01780, partial [Firmicutes bacterium]|nr:hypothetical protein [Bacillota bacterium]
MEEEHGDQHFQGQSLPLDQESYFGGALKCAMEDFQVDFIVDKGAFAKTIKVPLKKFTLVGATT